MQLAYITDATNSDIGILSSARIYITDRVSDFYNVIVVSFTNL